MLKNFLVFTLLFVALQGNAQNDTIHFPDKYLKWLLTSRFSRSTCDRLRDPNGPIFQDPNRLLYQRIDQNFDGKITWDEAELIYAIRLDGSISTTDSTQIQIFPYYNAEKTILKDPKIRSFEGFEEWEFPNLKKLEIHYTKTDTIGYNNFPSNINYLDCSYNQISFIAFDGDTLICTDNKLQSNSSIYINNSIKYLDCRSNLMSSLDYLSYYPNLTFLNCSNNSISSLDISKNPLLKNLYVYNNKLTTLDVSGNLNLVSLGCGYNSLKTLDISRNKDLNFLGCENNLLSSLDLKNNTKLGGLSCNNNSIPKLRLNNFTKLKGIDCSYNLIDSLDLSKNDSLAYVKIDHNKIVGSLDLSKTHELYYVNCSDNKITSSLNLSKSPNLEYLNCSNNLLSTLIVKDSSKIKELYCENNQISSLSVSNSQDLKYLNCKNNTLDILNVHNTPVLQKMDCSNNKIKTLDLEKSTLLDTLDCNYNQLDLLNLNTDTSLSSLNCKYNKLKSIDIANSLKIKYFDCHVNNLSTLDVRNLDEMVIFKCQENPFLSLVCYTSVPTDSLVKDTHTKFSTKCGVSILNQSTEGQSCCNNQKFSPIFITLGDTSNVSYQWYSKSTKSNLGGTSVGALGQKASFTPSATKLGTNYYYCVATNKYSSDTSYSSGAFVVNAASSQTISKTACNSYKMPSGKRTITISGVHKDTLVNKKGCDSVLIVNLTIKKAATATIAVNTCNSYKVPSGKRIYTQSGIYKDTLLTIWGCDSIITIDLKFKGASYSNILVRNCDTYKAPSGKRTFAVSGIYKDTLKNRAGCDSIVTINLTIKKATNSTLAVNTCNNFKVPSGKRVYSQSGIFKDTLINTSGCDSIITIYLTIKNTSYSNIFASNCETYKAPSGKQTFTNSGIYKDTLISKTGCDSIVIINLTIEKTTTAFLTVNTCNSYKVPSGKRVYSQTGLYKDTILNSSRCDSIITINLKIINTSYSSIFANQCDTYKAPSGKRTFAVSGIYKDILTNRAGCDSIVTINLTIKKATNSSLTVSTCNYYKSPSGKRVYTQSGIFKDTILNASSCDSIINIDLTIKNTSYSNIFVSNCETYKALSGKQTLTNSGIYKDTLISKTGCDSIVILNLTITKSTTSEIYVNSCTNYTSPSGKRSLAVSGIYYDTIPNKSGCDSLLTIHLKKLRATKSITQISACNQYITPSGKQTLVASGKYIDYFTNEEGCDSVIELDLKIDSVSSIVTYNNATNELQNATIGGNFQWFDCTTKKDILNATNSTFNPEYSGEFGVQVSKNTCNSIASMCYVVNNEGTSTPCEIINVFPNPGKGHYTLDLGCNFKETSIEIVDLTGNTIYTKTFLEASTLDFELIQPKGIYILKIQNGNRVNMLKIIHL